MNRSPLVHAYPQWEPPENEPSAPQEEWSQIWTGQMRVVRNRRRIRKLQRRGVPMMDLRARNADGYRGTLCMAWFVESR